MDRFAAFVIGWTIAWCIMGAFFFAPKAKELREFKKEAVSLGHAEWVVDVNGDTEFKFVKPNNK